MQNKTTTRLIFAGVGAAIATGVLLGSAARAGGYGPHPAFDRGPDCGHVIHLLMRYGAGQGVSPAGGLPIGSPVGPVVMPVAELGDLRIESVTECVTDPACPPAFVVTIHNGSPRAVCNLQLSLVALLGPIRPIDPTAIATVEEIPAGALVEVRVEMPASALRMGANGGVAVGFDRLLVAIDSLDRFAEIDESNNLLLINRCDVPQQTVVVVEAPAVEAAPVEAAPVEAAPLPEAPVTAPIDQRPLDAALEEFGIDRPASDATAQRL